jgi:hypothetical protein
VTIPVNSAMRKKERKNKREGGGKRTIRPISLNTQKHFILY